jgi:molybdopterin-guanine dinucleotide biosynthesis protein A
MRGWGVVLAGGKSSRMGEDKKNLRWEGETLLDRSKRILSEVVGAERVLVSGGPPGSDSCPDLIAELGPLGGLYSILERLKEEGETWILVIPVDMPLIKTDLLSFLVIEWERLLIDQAKAETCGLQFEGFELPTVLRVDSGLRHIVSSLCEPGVAEGQRSFKNLKFCIDMKSVAIPADRQTMFVNINNKDDWMSLHGG